LIYKLFRTLYMSCNVISQKPIKRWPLNTFFTYLLLTYLLTYLLKSNPGNLVPATGYPVPKPILTSNHYHLMAFFRTTQWNRYQNAFNMDFIGAKDDGCGGDNSSSKTCKVPVNWSPSTNHHPAFYRPDALPVAHPTASENWIQWNCSPQYHKITWGGSSYLVSNH